jgi:hypothetical protein
MHGVKDPTEELPNHGIGTSKTSREDTMKKLLVVPAVLLLLACQDHNPVQPAPDLTAELALAQAPGGLGNVVKMVPYRSSGTLRVVDRFYDPVNGCQGRLDCYSVIIEMEGNATHTGRYRGTETLCYSLVEGELQSNRGILTTANGDLLHFRGSKEDYGSVMTFHADNTWELAPIYFHGGTGRFVNAEGELFLWGTLSPDRTVGTVNSEGWISSVGSSK